MAELDIIYQILIPSISSIASVLLIGWKIKDALCKQISQIEIKLGTHIGITEPQKKEIIGKIDNLEKRFNKLILENNLKI